MMKNTYKNKLNNTSQNHRRRHRPDRQSRLSFEPLEDRRMLSLIVWGNRSAFTNQFGASTAAARGVVDAAIQSWSEVIESFNFQNVGQNGWAPQNSYTINVGVTDMQAAGGNMGVLARGGPRGIDIGGKPYSGRLTLDNDAAGGMWYFDADASSDFEFTNPIAPFAAAGGPAGSDLYSVCLHEIGHALGFSNDSRLAIRNHITNNSFVFDDGTTATLTNDNVHTNSTRHPNDLMNPTLSASTRNTISDIDARILGDGYDYTIDLQFTDNRSFVTSYNPTTRQLTVNGDLGTTASPLQVFDQMYLNVFPDEILVDVNGYTKRIATAAVGSIFMVGGKGNDVINVESTIAGQPLTINAGPGENFVVLSSGLHNLLHIQGDVNVFEQGGQTNLSLRDDGNSAARNFSVSSELVTFNGSNATIRFGGYADPTSNAYGLVLRGGFGGNSFNVSTQFNATSAVKILAGTGNDTVNAFRTGSRGLTIDGVAGNDVVKIGTVTNNMLEILGPIHVSNSSGYTDLILNDSANPNASPDIRITDNEVRGMSPAPILLDPRGIRSITARAGSELFVGNVIRVVNTPQNRARNLTVNLDTGRASDRIFVRATSSVLNINGQNGRDTITIGNNGLLQGILRPITIASGTGLTAVTIDDSNNLSGRSPFLTKRSVIGLAPAMIAFGNANLNSLTLWGGRGGNLFTIFDTPQNVAGTLAVKLNAGAGADTVNVRQTTGELDLNGRGGQDTVNIGREGSLADILGEIRVSNSNTGGYTALNIDGSNDAGARTATISAAIVSGMSPAGIRYAQIDLRSMTVSAGAGGNTIDVIDTPQNGIGSVEVTLNSGNGVDTVNVQQTKSYLKVNGRNGADTVNVGLNGNMQGITGLLDVSNTGNWSTLNLDDSADVLSRTVSMNVVGNVGSVSGLAPARIRYLRSSLGSLNVYGGSGNNTFDVLNTAQSSFAAGSRTTLYAGSGSDGVNVFGTTGALIVDPQGNNNTVIVGGRPGSAGSLNVIRGDVTFRGEGAATGNFVQILDRTNSGNYILEELRFQRISPLTGAATGNIHFGDLVMEVLDIVGGDTGSSYYVYGSPETNNLITEGGVRIFAGNANDTAYIYGNSGRLLVDMGGDMGGGSTQFVQMGDSTHSLDAIGGTVRISGGGFIDAFISDEASTVTRRVDLDSNELGQQIFERFEFVTGSGQKLNTFQFDFDSQGRVNYQAGHHQGGGQYNQIDVHGVPENTEIIVSGGPHYDVFTVGFAADTSRTLGKVSFYSLQDDLDFAYFYDYLLNAPGQTYTVRTSPLDSNAAIVERPGRQPVLFNGLTQLIFYTPHFGGSEVNIQSLPEDLFFNLALSNSDHATLGSAAPGTGGTLDGIKGAVAIATGLVDDVVSVLIDDSGNNLTARDVSITSPVEPGGFTRISGLASSEISIRDYHNLNIEILAGGLDDRFVMSGTPLVSHMTIDGGAGNDTLVGSGGNVLRGGAGRDLLIAGASPGFLDGGQGEDILIGGTLLDTSATRLDAIMTEWLQTGVGNDYNSRVTRLRADLLSDESLSGNGGGNTLTGGADSLDLFFGSLASDWQEGEIVVTI